MKSTLLIAIIKIIIFSQSVFVTKEFQEGSYSFTLYSCVIVGYEEGLNLETFELLEKFETLFRSEISKEKSEALLRDALLWYKLSKGKIDFERFFESECDEPLLKMEQLLSAK